MKKTMRKSALLSSVAMLIVSAIVLTTSTYAWFSASKVAEVKTLESTVLTSTGLLIKLDNSGWDSTVDASAYKPQQFNPVSTADAKNFFAGNYNAGALELTANNLTNSSTTDNYLAFNIQVKGPVGGKVTVTPAFSVDGGKATSADVAKSLKFAFVKADGTAVSGIMPADGTSSGGYSGVTSAGDGKVACDKNSAAYLATENTSAVTENTDGSFEITLANAAGDAYKVYVWVEGNDADCSAETIQATDIVFGLNFQLA